VVNPYAGSLTWADATVRARRDHVKYLTLIAAVTLLYQHQREIKTVSRGGTVIRYVETTRADIELTDQLAVSTSGPPSRVASISAPSSGRSRPPVSCPGVAHLQARPLGVDVVAEHPAGVDADYLWRQAGQAGHLAVQGLSEAADLQEADALGPAGNHIVDHEGHLRTVPHVAVLRALAHVVSADVDRAELTVVGEADGFHLRGAAGCHRCQPPMLVAGQEALFDAGEYHGC
jgi:hypothetical protein